MNYTIKDLLPFTIYRAAVACKEESDIWSDWSSEVSARTLDRGNSFQTQIKLLLGTEFTRKIVGGESEKRTS